MTAAEPVPRPVLPRATGSGDRRRAGHLAAEWPPQPRDRRSRVATSCLMRPSTRLMRRSTDRKRRQSRQSAHSVPSR
jgi:hypothetical protein